MKIHRFEDIIGWQKAQDLAIQIYNKFGDISDFDFRRQICRASVSISNNIAEGFERKGDKEFTRFLYIALGSASEVKSMLYLAERLGYIEENERLSFHQDCTEVSKLIKGFINAIN